MGRLKRFAAADQSHPPGAFVNDRGSDRFCQIRLAAGSTARIDQPDATHVVVDHLVTT